MNEKTKTFDALGMASLRRKKSGRDKKYATFNRRMLAATIDSLALMFAAPLFNRFFPIQLGAAFQSLPETDDPQEARQWMIDALTDPVFLHSWMINGMAQAVVFCLLSAVCWHFWAATPGKMLLRLKVVDADTEQPLSDRQSAIRAVTYLLSGAVFFLGFLWICFDRRRQGWHDKLANTVVIVQPWKKKEQAP